MGNTIEHLIKSKADIKKDLLEEFTHDLFQAFEDLIEENGKEKLQSLLQTRKE